MQYSYAADVGLLNGQLKVIYSDNNIFIDRTNFTLYKCHLLGSYLNRPDCSLCQRIDSRFGCAWCSGACQHRARCAERPDDTCPAPRIDFVHPLSGPALGGTRVTIEGSNLGQSFDEIANRVKIGNVPCKPIEDEYRPSNRIVCVTSAVVARHPGLPGGARRPAPMADGFAPDATGAPMASSVDVIAADILVGNRAGYSVANTKFHFKSIYLRDHQPRYGPQSGGTRLTLTGLNLNIGSSIQVLLDELPCQVEASLVTSEQIVCRTGASRHASRAIKQLRLVIDDAQIVRDDDVFYYTQDPVISKVSPLRAYLSGGRPINVFGANLTAVQAPRMAIHDLASGKKINESACILQDDSRMQCPAPAVNLQLMDLEYVEQHAAGAQYEPHVFSGPASAPTWATGRLGQLFQQDESVKFRLSFVMDNVQQTSYPAFSAEIAYTSDPRLFAFASAQYRAAQEAELAAGLAGAPAAGHNEPPPPAPGVGEQPYQVEADAYLLQPGEPVLVLYGEHLRAAVGEYEITVTVGQDLCNLTQLSDAKLVCLLDLDHVATPTDEEGHQTARLLPLVVVRVGFNLRYELGYVQYHPALLHQVANSTGLASSAHIGPGYTQYLPRQTGDGLLHRLSGYLASALTLLFYAALVALLLAFLYTGLPSVPLACGLKLARPGYLGHGRGRVRARLDSLERSVRHECRVASLALQGDLNELVRHVDLSGVPLLSAKHYIMKVFFPGMNNHPLLVKAGPGELMQATGHQHQHQPPVAPTDPHQHQAPLAGLQPTLRPAGTDSPMDYFEQLVLTKPFLVAFVNTLERQASFTIRDRVNVASLLMVVLLERLDYATDILRTLLFQLVERSVRSGQTGAGDEQPAGRVLAAKLTRRASNLLNGLPISKRHTSRAANLGKFVGGSANSLMASTSVAAQMLLARMGTKTAPLQHQAACDEHLAYQQQRGPAQTHDTSVLDQCDSNNNNNNLEFMSTTAFNQRHFASGRAPAAGANRHRDQQPGGRRAKRAASRPVELGAAKRAPRRNQNQAHLMLRRTDTIVEKMLTNWLALNMYDHFHGQMGQALYMLFEALKCQLERGPIDAISGDAYYSLNEAKLLREPAIQFEVVNLYVIVDAHILQPHRPDAHPTPNNLLLDSTSVLACGLQPFCNEQNSDLARQNRHHHGQYATSNTITLALRVLDCDTISQTKAKILAALYRNSAYSGRLGVDDVELSLRQQHQTHTLGAHHQTLSSGQSQYVSVTLQDEDYTTVTSFNGLKRINTLRHYGVTDQGIMMLNRCRASRQPAGLATGAGATANGRTALTDMLEEHYNNPYSEIQYAPIGCQTSASHKFGCGGRQQASRQPNMKSWHLIKTEERTSGQVSDSDGSSPSLHSPSMMLLGNESHLVQPASQPALRLHHYHQQQYYHPSSSSTSSTGNVMDTNSTSANSSSVMNVANLLAKSRHDHHNHHHQHQQQQQQQPIYCQIGSVSAHSQHGGTGSSSYYCQIGANNNLVCNNYLTSRSSSETMQHQQQQAEARRATTIGRDQENQIYLTRMLTSKGTVQQYIDEFFKTILAAKPGSSSNDEHQQQQIYEDANFSPVLCAGDAQSGTTRRPTTSSAPLSACPPAVKWLFDLLDEAAMRNGITDQNVIHAWKSNAFLLRFWVNFIKNPNYILDVEKSNTLDASLSVVAQTLMDSCATNNQKLNKVSMITGYLDHLNHLIFVQKTHTITFIYLHNILLFSLVTANTWIIY